MEKFNPATGKFDEMEAFPSSECLEVLKTKDLEELFVQIIENLEHDWEMMHERLMQSNWTLKRYFKLYLKKVKPIEKFATQL